MTEIIERVATTHPIKQGNRIVRMTKESLDSATEQVNGDRAMPFTVQHDPFCLPIGKTTEAWVEPYENEHALMARTYFEDAFQNMTHKISEAQLVCLDFKDAPKPFIRRYENIGKNQFIVCVDWANFDSRQEVTEFTDDVGKIDDEIICGNLGRYSLGPEPIIEFVLSNPGISAALAVGIWTLARVERFVRYTVDETLRKVADELANSLSGKLRDILTAYRNRQSEDDRPILTKIVIPGDMDLILLERIPRGEEFERLDLTKLTAGMEKHGRPVAVCRRSDFRSIREQ